MLIDYGEVKRSAKDRVACHVNLLKKMTHDDADVDSPRTHTHTCSFNGNLTG